MDYLHILSNLVTKASTAVRPTQVDHDILEQKVEKPAEDDTKSPGTGEYKYEKDPEPYAKGPRILLLGDSWAHGAWQKNEDVSPFRDALGKLGHSRNLVAGEITALGGTLAGQWMKAVPDISTRGYEALRSKLSEHRKIKNKSPAQRKAEFAEHHSIASLHTITEALNRFQKIDMIHLSLGGNDLMARELDIPEARLWRDIWHKNPDSGSAHQDPDILRAFGWRRKVSDLSTGAGGEQEQLTTAQNSLTAKMPEISKRIIDQLDTVINHIHSIDSGIRVYLIGYTPLFIYPESPRPIADVVKDLDAIARNESVQLPNRYFSATSFGMQFDYFNAVCLAALQREAKNRYGKTLAAGRANVMFQCYFFEPPNCDLSPANVSDYYSKKKYEDDDYFQRLKGFETDFFKNLGLDIGKELVVRDDGFHLTARGYQEVAENCIEYLYQPWLSKNSTRKSVPAP